MEKILLLLFSFYLFSGVAGFQVSERQFLKYFLKSKEIINDHGITTLSAYLSLCIRSILNFTFDFFFYL